MSLHTRFERAFDGLRARLRASHPGVAKVIYELPSSAGATLRVRVGVVVQDGASHAGCWDIEQTIRETLTSEGLPEPTEILWASPEELGGRLPREHFFPKVPR
jgi:hypothetical protein